MLIINRDEYFYPIIFMEQKYVNIWLDYLERGIIPKNDLYDAEISFIRISPNYIKTLVLIKCNLLQNDKIEGIDLPEGYYLATIQTSKKIWHELVNIIGGINNANHN